MLWRDDTGFVTQFDKALLIPYFCVKIVPFKRCNHYHALVTRYDHYDVLILMEFDKIYLVLIDFSCIT